MRKRLVRLSTVLLAVAISVGNVNGAYAADAGSTKESSAATSTQQSKTATQKTSNEQAAKADKADKATKSEKTEQTDKAAKAKQSAKSEKTANTETKTKAATPAPQSSQTQKESKQGTYSAKSANKSDTNKSATNKPSTAATNKPTSNTQASKPASKPHETAIEAYARTHTWLGKATRDELKVRGGASRTYQHGTVFWSPSTGAHAVRDGIHTKYAQLRYEQGLLGFPVSDEHRLSRNGGASQEFQHGQIHWSASTGMHFTRDGIQSYWASKGWENGWLGYPTGDELQVRGGASQTFQGGTVFWSKSTGMHAVRAGMLTKYSQMGFEQGLLGFPVSDERRLSRNGGASQEFQHGQIHWTASTGMKFTRGTIQDYWKSSGWENGWLGYPTGDELQVRGGASQTFQGGTVFWSKSTGAHAVSGSVLDQYRAQRFEQGHLGFPTSEEYDWGKGRAQSFQHGRLEWHGCGKKGWQNPGQYFQVSSCDVSVPGSGKFAYASSSRIGMSASRNQAIEAMISRAYDYMNTRYVWDYALRPGEGVDCAGLVMQALYATGMDLHEYNPSNHWYDPWHSHDANNMAADGRFKHVSLNERQRGDLIFWRGHVAIYLGNDQIIEANVPRVRTSSLWRYGNTITAVARPFV